MAIFCFPRPQSFLRLIPLRTATEFILFLLGVNKVTGLYGILALLTGYPLNPLQLSHYIYSLAVLGPICYLSPAIRGQQDSSSTVKVIALAWVYVLDTVINSVYTMLFGLGWFALLARQAGEGSGALDGMGQGTMNETAGFTSPEHDVSKVDIFTTPAPGAMPGQEARLYAISGSLSSAVLSQGSVSTLAVLVALWVIRVYFCVVVLSYARSTLRAYIASTSATSYSTASDANIAENPFRHGRAEGEGWRGALGRSMLRFPTKRYWLGRDESQAEWASGADARLEGARGLRIKVPGGSVGGVGERERRARSGTGPSVPMLPLKGKAEY
ncbi:hypothetical protein LTR62_006003 [Meristemomyces frigidus]|uniref:DUF1753-domain-containing protein n=1 Tax=Meristemomyces frigidus TaxID=1508187 RepID=A0AAN7TI03_9PEZI|nr:hypothetical protein LTR62_006003 [Meristemomyces frigidus]